MFKPEEPVKVRTLWLTTGSMNTEPVVHSIECVKDFHVENETFVYEGINHEILHDAFLFEINKFKPDVIFYVGSCEGPDVPDIETLHHIKKICPTVHMVFDGGCSGWWPLLKHYREKKTFSLTVNIDGNHDWPKGDGDITILCPIDTRHYHAKELNKDIALGFHGGVNGSRSAVINALLTRGFLTLGERNESLGSYQGYADFMKRCQMVLNMAATGGEDNMHVKARVIEAGLAGACLLEPKGSPTSRWFRPNVDYVEYSSIEHLIKCVEELQSGTFHESWETFATRLHERVTQEYSPYVFYSRIFKRLGVDI